LVGVKSKNKIQAIVNVDGIVSFIHPEAEESTYALIGWTETEKAI
jgi:Mg/Co/Ni transporter MgtE